MLGVSGTPVLDAVGKLGDLGDRLDDKRTLCVFLLWTDDLAGRSVGWIRLLYILSTTIRSDGDYPLKGIPLRLHPTIRFGMAVDAINVSELPTCLPHYTPRGGLTDDPDLPSDGPYL